MFDQRSQELEWMDLGKNFYTQSQYNDCLYQLDRIGRFLGGDKATFWALNQLPSPPGSILDVGCGGGLFTLRLAEKYRKTQVVGIDISPEAIAFAQERLKEHQPVLSNIEFFVPHSSKLDESLSADVITATLVCHHFADHEVVSFLQQTCRLANKSVIINDLHRNRLAYIGFALCASLLFPNRMIWHDGLLSIRRSFTRYDWKKFLKDAAIDECYYTISWHWAFRWIVAINVEEMKKNGLFL